MANEVLAWQAKTRAEQTGEAFEDALEAVMGTEAGRQLKELRNGSHHGVRAQDLQERLARERAEERADTLGWSPSNKSLAPRWTSHGRVRDKRLQGTAPVPEAWIGRSVELVFISGASTEYADGTLQEVNNRGIVLSVETHVGHPAQPLFYPWGAVIQLSEERNG